MAERVLTIRRRRWLPLLAVGGAVVLVVAGGSYVANGAGAGSEKAALRTAQVTTGSIEQTLTLTGSVSRVNQLTAHFPVGGTVTGVSVAVGDIVVAGQPLATMDPIPLNQAVLDAQATLDQARATLATDTATAAAASSSSSSSSGSSASRTSTSSGTSTGGTGGSGGSGGSSGTGGSGGSQGAVSAALAAVEAAQASSSSACALVLGATAGAPPTATATATTATAASTAASTASSTASAPSSSASVPTAQDIADCLASLESLAAAERAAGVALTSYAGSLNASAAQAAAAAAAQAEAQAKAAAAAAAAQQAAAASRTQTGTVSEARLITDRANVANAEAALTKAQKNLAATTLTAPMAGRVGAIAWAVGDTATAANGIQILGSGAAKVTVQVPAANVASVAVGQVAHVMVTGVPVMEGSVSQVALLPTTTNGSSATTYAVDVLVPAAPDAVGTGGKASVAIVIAKVDGVLTVPASAVTGVGAGTASVGLLRSGVVTATIVQIGAVGGGKVQILSGLSLGDTVVIGDASQPLPTNGGFGGFGGGIGGLTGGGGVRVPGAGIGGGGAPPGGAPAGR